MNYFMKKNNTLLTIILLTSLSLNSAFGQKSNVWLTYGQSTFMYSPGVEANFFFNRYIGLQLGANTYFHRYDENRIVNVSDKNLFDFYNANLNICSYPIFGSKQKMGITIGFKYYYGPEYDILHYYKNDGYNIYFDSSGFSSDYGIDFGIFYLFKRLSIISKFDTARNKLRIGIGYAFGNFE